MFCDFFYFLSTLVKQFAALLVKVNCKFFKKFYDVTGVYFKTNVELLKQNNTFWYDYFDYFARLDALALLIFVKR